MDVHTETKHVQVVKPQEAGTVSGWPLAFMVAAIAMGFFGMMTIMATTTKHRQAANPPTPVVVHFNSNQEGCTVYAVPKSRWGDGVDGSLESIQEYRVGMTTNGVAFLWQKRYVVVFEHDGRTEIIHIDVRRDAVNIYEVRFDDLEE